MKKGFTLVEILVALSLFSIILLTGYGLISSNDSIYSKIQVESDCRINIRIGIEYLTDRIMEAKSVFLSQDGNLENSVEHIRVETCSGNPKDTLIIDGEKLYIKKDIKVIMGIRRVENILRCNSDSQQIVPNIYAFEIWDKGSGLYLVKIYKDNPNNHEDSVYPDTHIISSYVKKRS